MTLSGEWRSIPDWIEDLRQADLAKERGEYDAYYARIREMTAAGLSRHLAEQIDRLCPDYFEPLCELMARGVTPILGLVILKHNGGQVDPDAPLEDLAEAAALRELVETCEVNTESRPEMARARLQASYARKLTINWRYLVHNLRRNLSRYRRRLHGVHRRQKRRRPHNVLGSMTYEERQRAEYLWDHGANHGMGLFDALFVSARDNPAVYRRVHRVVSQVLEEGRGRVNKDGYVICRRGDIIYRISPEVRDGDGMDRNS